MKLLRSILEDFVGRIVVYCVTGVLAVALLVGVVLWWKGSNDEQSRIARKNTDESLSERVEIQAERERLAALRTEAQKKIEEDTPGFLFIGDDFIAGRGGGNTDMAISLRSEIEKRVYSLLDFQSVVAEKYRDMVYNNRHRFGLDNVPLVNLGVSLETTDTTVAMSGTKIVLTNPVTITEKVEAIRVDIAAENGDRILPLLGTDFGTAQVVLMVDDDVENGIKGTLSRVDVVDKDDPDYPCYYRFMRDREGDAVTLLPGAAIVTQNALHYRDYVLVIMMGVNGGYDTVEELIAQHFEIIHSMTDPGERYFVLGLPFADDETELAMKEAFGDQFFSTRDYFTTDALADSGVIITQSDRDALEKGEIPPALLNSTKLFFGSYGYNVLGQELYRRMDALGYFDGMKAAINDALTAAATGEPAGEE